MNNPKDKNSEVATIDEEWRKELAMEAGMCMGIEAYNEYMGYEVYEDITSEVDEE